MRNDTPRARAHTHYHILLAVFPGVPGADVRIYIGGGGGGGGLKRGGGRSLPKGVWGVAPAAF